jgi:hypothetical protein
MTADPAFMMTADPPMVWVAARVAQHNSWPTPN